MAEARVIQLELKLRKLLDENRSLTGLNARLVRKNNILAANCGRMSASLARLQRQMGRAQQ